MAIQSIYELFILDGADFVTAAYRNLFSREPDEHGLAYYVGRLSLGYGKENVVAQMAKSPECINHQDIEDLKQLIRNEHRARHWFWGMFARDNRVHKSMQSNLNVLGLIRQNINAVQDVISAQSQQTIAFTQQLVSLNQANQSLNQQIAELIQQTVAYSPPSQPDETPRLPDEVVRQCFADIMGREPESEEIIKHHARLATREALQENLIHSEEFQHKLLALPEYARGIFRRQIQIHHAF